VHARPLRTLPRSCIPFSVSTQRSRARSTLADAPLRRLPRPIALVAPDIVSVPSTAILICVVVPVGAAAANSPLDPGCIWAIVARSYERIAIVVA
jgi:hypothetical protein